MGRPRRGLRGGIRQRGGRGVLRDHPAAPVEPHRRTGGRPRDGRRGGDFSGPLHGECFGGHPHTAPARIVLLLREFRIQHPRPHRRSRHRHEMAGGPRQPGAAPARHRPGLRARRARRAAGPRPVPHGPPRREPLGHARRPLPAAQLGPGGRTGRQRGRPGRPRHPAPGHPPGRGGAAPRGAAHRDVRPDARGRRLRHGRRLGPGPGPPRLAGRGVAGPRRHGRRRHRPPAVPARRRHGGGADHQRHHRHRDVGRTGRRPA